MTSIGKIFTDLYDIQVEMAYKEKFVIEGGKKNTLLS